MFYPEKKITIKNSQPAVLRSPVPEDAHALLHSFQQSVKETPYLLSTPEEVLSSVEQEQAFIEYTLRSESECMILCLIEGTIAGNCSISRRTNTKLRHRGTIGIALLKKFWNLGIGQAMIQTLIQIGRDWHLEQLELDVVEGNQRAIALYEKSGFRTVGVVPNGFHLMDGSRCGEIKMVLEL